MSAPLRVRLPPHTLRMTTRGADGLFGPPVGGVDRGVAQEEEHGRELVGEMLGEAPGVLQRRRRVDQPAEPGLEPAAEGVEAVPGQFAVPAAVPPVEAGLENGLDLRTPGAVGVLLLQFPATLEQVIDATLVRTLVAPVHLPAVAHEHAGVVGPEQGGRILEPAAGADGVDGGLRGDGRPQPSGA